MTELLAILIAMVVAFISTRSYSLEQVKDVVSPKETQTITRLWEYTSAALKKQRWDSAERALLKILKYDHKNVSAYNQLGMIYVRTQQLDNAIACFDIASSLAPSVSSLYNLGLVQYQSGNYEAASRSLERVVDLEPTTKRRLVFAKILQKQGKQKRVIDVLEALIKDNPSERNLRYLAEAYENNKQPQKAEAIYSQVATMEGEKPALVTPQNTGGSA